MSTRVVAVRPPNARQETAYVALLALAIIAAAGAHLALLSKSPGAPEKREGEVLFMNLGFEEQRAFRELQEGLVEAERLRADKGRWPSAEELRAEQIPPFAAGGYQSLENNVALNYAGVRGESLFLAVIQEPGEWAAPGSVKLDEDHRQLRDGDMLHVSIWVAKSTAVLKDVITNPPVHGFTRIRLAPSKEEK